MFPNFFIKKSVRSALNSNSLKPFSSSSKSSCSTTNSTVGVLGVPFAKGQSKEGVENAPDRLRKAGLINCLKEASSGKLKINDYGNLNFKADLDCKYNIPNLKNIGEVIGCNRALITKTQEILQQNDQILTIGGDHSIGFGSVAGHLLHQPNLGLVWIDAHADINLPTTSPSGNAHGMPVAMLLKELQFWKTLDEQITPVCLSPKQLVYIGLRAVDPYEAYILKTLGIKSFSMDIIDRLGMQKIIEMTLDAIKPQQKIHISFDIDSLDSRIAPSTGTKVEGGLTIREGISIVEALRDTKRVEGFDLVEVNLSLGSEENVCDTISAGFEILKSLYGQQRGGNSDAAKQNIFEENL